MRSIFCGNFESDTRPSELERLFRRYGKVDRVDMKSGFAFVYMVDERDAEDAIRALDQIEFGRRGRRLRVEWTKQERSSRRPERSTRRSSSNLRPAKTLFVINFDPYHTRTRDLERHFDRYGKILNVRIKKNFGFIQFESQEDATKALDATNMSKLLGRVISVEYSTKDDDDKRNGYIPERVRDRSPRRGYDRARSPSPRRRERGSPDYGPGSARGHSRSPSPYRRERASPDYARDPSRSPSRKERDLDRDRGRSPSRRKERDVDYHERRSPIPRTDRGFDVVPSPPMERSNGDNGQGPSPGVEIPGYGHGPSPGPTIEEEKHREMAMIPDDYAHGRSPAYSDAGSPPREHGYESI